MFRFLITLTFVFPCFLDLVAQHYFSRTYELEEDVWVSGSEVDVYEDHLYIMTGKICHNPNRECGDIVKMDFEGNIIWKREIGAFDIGNTNAVWIHNDTITITGHRNSMNQPFGFFIQQITTDGDSLTNYLFPVDTSVVGNAFNYGTTYFDNSFYLYGTGKAPDGSVDAILMKINNAGELVHSRIWDEGLRELQFSELTEINGGLVYLSEKKEFNTNNSYFYIENLFEDCSNSILSTAEVEADIGVLDRFTYSDGNYFIPTAHEFLISSLPVFYILDSDGQQIGYFEFEHQIGVNISRFISELITTKNGDIVGVGDYQEVGSTRMGWMFRMSSSGDLLWETTFRSQDWDNDEKRVNDLNDIVELEDGSLVAVGWYEETTDPQSPRDLWVIRVGPDGCLYEEDCGFNQFTTSSIDEDFDTIETCVFPNPAFNMLYIDSINEFDSFKIIQLDGRLVMDGEFHPNIDVSNLDSGMYVIQFVKKGTAESVKKFIKY